MRAPQVHIFRRRSRRGRPWVLWIWTDGTSKGGRLTRQVRGTLREAEREAREWEADLSASRRERRSTAWPDFLRLYLGALAARAQKRTVAEVRGVLAMFARAMAPERLEQVDRRMVTAYLTARRDATHPGARPGARPVSEATFNKYLRILRAAFRWAIDEDLFFAPSGLGPVAKNPCQGIRRLRENRLRHVVYGEAERDRLLAAAAGAAGGDDRAVEMAVRLGITCGLRVGEIAHLSWASADLQNRMILVQREADGWHPKDHEARRVAMDPALAELLAAEVFRQAPPDPAAGRLCGGSDPEGFILVFRKALRRLCEASGLESIHPHGLRRSFATILAARGVSPQDLKTVMGHASITTTWAYYVKADQEASARRAMEAQQGIAHTGPIRSLDPCRGGTRTD